MAKKSKEAPEVNNTKSLAEASTSKKIGFFSAILIVMGSSIGAGIFFKAGTVLGNSQWSLVLAIFCWIIAAISVVAMALALVEVSSARNDNLSMIGWTKVFNGRTTFKACKNFMFYVYLPLTYFFMPLYVIMSLQDGISWITGNDTTFGTSADWVIWTVISLVMSAYFIFISGMSSKAGNIQNQVVTYIKFLPLAMVAILGFVLIGKNGWPSSLSATVQRPVGSNGIEGGLSFIDLAPGLGMFMAVSAIFFAYDGFYVAAGIQSDMKEPKKTPLALLFGLLASTVIYLIIAISMSLAGGGLFTFSESMTNTFDGGNAGGIVAGIINIMVSIGVLGILNGFAMWAPRFVEDLIKEGELPYSYKYKDKLNSDKPMIGIYYSAIISLPVVIVFTLIGALAYIENPDYSVYGSGMGKLYTFADLMATWTAAFTFGYITLSIFGALKNRKTGLIQTDQKSYFKPAAYVSIFMITLSLVVLILQPIIDLMLLAQVDKNLVNASGGNYTDIVVGRIMLVVTLLLFIGLAYGPTIIEDKMNIKKYGSIQAYEEWQKANFQVS